MQETEQISVTLPADLVARLRKRVRAEVSIDDSAVVAEALEEFDALAQVDAILPEMSDDEVDRWLRTEAVPALDELRRDPSRALTIEQVRTNLARDYLESLASSG